MRTLARLIPVFALAAVLSSSVAVAAKADDNPTTNQFQGPKANTGKAVYFFDNGKPMLKVTDDFKVPDTPAPTWRLVDAKGNIYTLDAFKIKGGEKRQIAVPNYIHDIVKVQVYCAWAEVILGEASFSSTIK